MTTILLLLAAALGACWLLVRASSRPVPAPACDLVDLDAQWEALEIDFNSTERSFRKANRDFRAASPDAPNAAAAKNRQPKSLVAEAANPETKLRPQPRLSPPCDGHGVPYPKLPRDLLDLFIEYRKNFASRDSEPATTPARLQPIADSNPVPYSAPWCESTKPPTLLARCATIVVLPVRRILTLVCKLAAYFLRPKPPFSLNLAPRNH